MTAVAATHGWTLANVTEEALRLHMTCYLADDIGRGIAPWAVVSVLPSAVLDDARALTEWALCGHASSGIGTRHRARDPQTMAALIRKVAIAWRYYDADTVVRAIHPPPDALSVVLQAGWARVRMSNVAALRGPVATGHLVVLSGMSRMGVNRATHTEGGLVIATPGVVRHRQATVTPDSAAAWLKAIGVVGVR